MRVIRPAGPCRGISADDARRLVAAVAALERDGTVVPDGRGAYWYRGTAGIVFYTGEADPEELASVLAAGLAEVVPAASEIVTGGTPSAMLVAPAPYANNCRCVEVWHGRVLPSAAAPAGSICWRVVPASALLGEGFTDLDRVNAVLHSVLYDAGESVIFPDDAVVFDLRVADFRRVPVPPALAVAKEALGEGFDVACDERGRAVVVPTAPVMAPSAAPLVDPGGLPGRVVFLPGAGNKSQRLSWRMTCAAATASFLKRGAVAMDADGFAARYGDDARPNTCVGCGVPFDADAVPAFAVVGGVAPRFACAHQKNGDWAALHAYSPFEPNTPLPPILLCAHCAQTNIECVGPRGCLGGSLVVVRPRESAEAIASRNSLLSHLVPILGAEYTPLCVGAYVGCFRGERFVIADVGLGRHAAITHPVLARSGLPVLENIRIAQ